MRILHTSDLHLGEPRYGQKRDADEQRVIGEILEVCDQRGVDLLLVTGDVFSDRPRGPLAAIARRFFQQLAPVMHRGMRVMLLRGNHDSLPFFRLLRYMCLEWLDEQSSPPIIADLPDIYDIPGANLQVIALPYLAPSDLERYAADATIDADRRVVGLAGLLAKCLQTLYQRVQPDKRSIFAAHIMVRGARITPEAEFQTGYARELWLTPDMLPWFTSYNALGHIHLSHQLESVSKLTWYAGSPDRQDLGEINYRPQVLLVDLPDHPGGAARVTPIPLSRCTLFVKRMLRSPEDVHALCAEIEGTDPLGEVTLDINFADREDCEARLREAAPRLRITFEPRVQTPSAVADGINPHNVVATVRDYVERHYNEEHKMLLLAGFERLLEEVGP